jgi:hypothetical protein
LGCLSAWLSVACAHGSPPREASELSAGQVSAERGGNVAQRGSSEVADLGTPAQQRARSLTTYVYECEDGRRVRVQADDEDAYLISENFTALPLTAADAERSTYQLGPVRLHQEGEHALLDLPSGEQLRCVNRPQLAANADAAVRGAEFRGVGASEPFVLEISDAQVRVVAGSGEPEERYIFERSAPVQNGAVLQYRGFSGGQEIVVEVTPRACADERLRAESFGAAVRVDIGSKVLRGCGRDLSR